MALLTFQGQDLFTQVSHPRWGLRSDGFDTLTISYDGPYYGLAAFLSSKTKWEQSGIDSDMFLENVDVDDSKRYPKVDLRYIGCRNGNLPQGKNSIGLSIKSATYNRQNLTIQILYYAPTVTYTAIGRSPGTGISAIPSGPPKIIDVRVSAQSEGSVGYPVINNPQDAIAYFRQLILTVPNDQEIVPGQYWNNSVTRELTLI